MSHRKQKILSFLVTLSLLVGMVGIVNVDTSFAATKKIHLKKTTVTLTAGKTYQQKLINKKGKTIKATKVKWKSSKPSIAKIDKKGKIKAIKKGTVKMTAKYKGKTYKFTVRVKKKTASKTTPTVYDHNTSIKCEPSSITLKVGETKTVHIKTDHGCGFEWDLENSYADFEGKGTIEGTNTFVMNVTGKKEGETFLTIKDSKDKSVSTKLYVTVVS